MANETQSQKVKKIVFTSFGGGNDYSNVVIQEEDYPKIENSNEVLVQIKAAGFNFAELLQRQGFYNPRPKPPYTPGYEGAGVVKEVGADVKDFTAGDRVIVYGSSGIWKDVVRLPATNVVKMPNEMSFEDGAGLVINYMTAYNILFDLGHLRPGSKVLVHMAAGGVGMAATQLCKTVDNVTVFGTASLEKHEKIKENGVTHPIDYRNKNYVDEVRKVSPEGVDIVMDPLNGEDALNGFNLLKPLGHIIHFGASTMATENRSLLSAAKTWWKSLRKNSIDIMYDCKSMSGYHLGILITKPECTKKLNEDLNILLNMYRKGQIKVCVDSKFPFSKVSEAMHRMHSRKNVGKILLVPDSEFESNAAAPAN